MQPVGGEAESREPGRPAVDRQALRRTAQEPPSGQEEGRGRSRATPGRVGQKEADDANWPVEEARAAARSASRREREKRGGPTQIARVMER